MAYPGQVVGAIFAVLRRVLGWHGLSKSVAIALLLAFVTSEADALTLKPSGFAVLPSGPGMRVSLVHAPGNCASSCAEWISAEGLVIPATVAEFTKILKTIGRRKIPVFVHSPGGNIVASLAIRRLLRAHRLDVSVTRTLFQPCSGNCGSSGLVGTPTSSGAICASACAYLIAGGVRRFISPGSRVGVHDGSLPPVVVRFAMTTIDAKGKEVELGHKNVVVPAQEFLKASAKLQQKAVASNEAVHKMIEAYNRDMGITAAIGSIAFATRPPAIHWLTRSELSNSHLMTDDSGGEELVGVSFHDVPAVPAAYGLTRDARSK